MHRDLKISGGTGKPGQAQKQRGNRTSRRTGNQEGGKDNWQRDRNTGHAGKRTVKQMVQKEIRQRDKK
jgi:hypothetical protein